MQKISGCLLWKIPDFDWAILFFFDMVRKYEVSCRKGGFLINFFNSV